MRPPTDWIRRHALPLAVLVGVAAFAGAGLTMAGSADGVPQPTLAPLPTAGVRPSSTSVAATVPTTTTATTGVAATVPTTCPATTTVTTDRPGDSGNGQRLVRSLDHGRLDAGHRG